MEPNQPSSKARELAYNKIRSLLQLLMMLKLLSEDIDDGSHWKPFVMKHTPMDKRGGPKRGVK